MRWCFYDRILEIKYNTEITAEKTFSPAEDFFYDHFPEMALVPGVIQIEMIAQVAGRLISISKHHAQAKKKLVIPILQGVENCNFSESLLPNQKSLIHAKIVEMGENRVKVSGSIKLPSGKLTCRADIHFSVFTHNDPTGLDSLYGLPETATMEEINDKLIEAMAALKK